VTLSSSADPSPLPTVTPVGQTLAPNMGWNPSPVRYNFSEGRGSGGSGRNSGGSSIASGSPADKDISSPAFPSVNNGSNRNSPQSREIPSSHRNTFEGIDFDLKDLTGPQQELALKHREIVADRKREQEREKQDQQRLEDILKMCEDYQNEVSTEMTSSGHGAAAIFGAGFPSQNITSHNVKPPTHQLNAQQQNLFAKRSQHQAVPPVSLDVSREPPASPSGARAGGSMTKIKTNGSLMLNSPTNPHKDIGNSFAFQGSNSTSVNSSPHCGSKDLSLSNYSSNSEDETIGSSEDTGTIKKRPSPGEGPMSPFRQQLQQQHSSQQHSQQNSQHHSMQHSSSSNQQHQQQQSISSTEQHSSDSIHEMSYPSKLDTNRNISVEEMDKTRLESPSAVSNNSVDPPISSFSKSEMESGKVAESSYLTSTLDRKIHEMEKSLSSSVIIHDRDDTIQNGCISSLDHLGSDSRLSSNVNNSTRIHSDQDSFCELPENSIQVHSSLSGRSTGVDSTDSSNRMMTRADSIQSDSSSRTVRGSSGEHSSPSPPFAKLKEDSPTPVNSDVEQGEISAPPLTQKEEVQLKGQMDGLRLTKTTLLVRTSELKRQIAEIEILEGEAMRELDMETRLLEGEHRSQMASLQRDQDLVGDMKDTQARALDLATREREKEQRIIELEREKLIALEEQYHQLTARLMRASSSSDSTMVVDEETAARRVRLQQELERQRRLYDDLEFQQLEAEARFDSEKEQLNSKLMNQQAELLRKYKDREDRLVEIDCQQKEMLSSVKTNLETFKLQRQQLTDTYKKERSKVTHCDKRIVELSKILSLPEPTDGSMDDEEAPLPPIHYSPHHGRHRTPEDSLMAGDLRGPLEISFDAHASLGSMIIDQERRRIDELRRRAADEGRIQWEERRRAAEGMSRLQTDDQRLRDLNCKSFNSLESEDSSVSSSCDTPSEKEVSLSGGEEHLEKLAELERLLAQAQGDKMRLVDEQVKIRESEMNALQKTEALERELEQVRLRERQTTIQARPMTRFLPNTSEDFDLRAHIEASGHQLEACPYVVVTANSCRGFLHKMGGRIKTWKRRWFVFDRIKRKVFYFADKSESRLKGSVCFQAIEECYADHLKTVKSPTPKLTFCMKTCDRTYYLVAPSPETMTIWIEVLFSGAEGYQQFFNT